jgi:hypothetical protein
MSLRIKYNIKIHCSDIVLESQSCPGVISNLIILVYATPWRYLGTTSSKVSIKAPHTPLTKEHLQGPDIESEGPELWA